MKRKTKLRLIQKVVDEVTPDILAARRRMRISRSARIDGLVEIGWLSNQALVDIHGILEIDKETTS